MPRAYYPPERVKKNIKHVSFGVDVHGNVISRQRSDRAMRTWANREPIPEAMEDDLL